MHTGTHGQILPKYHKSPINRYITYYKLDSYVFYYKVKSRYNNGLRFYHIYILTDVNFIDSD